MDYETLSRGAVPGESVDYETLNQGAVVSVVITRHSHRERLCVCCITRHTQGPVVCVLYYETLSRERLERVLYYTHTHRDRLCVL